MEKLCFPCQFIWQEKEIVKLKTFQALQSLPPAEYAGGGRCAVVRWKAVVLCLAILELCFGSDYLSTNMKIEKAINICLKEQSA